MADRDHPATRPSKRETRKKTLDQYVVEIEAAWHKSVESIIETGRAKPRMRRLMVTENSASIVHLTIGISYPLPFQLHL